MNFKENFSLKDYNSFHTNVSARRFVEIDDEVSLKSFFAAYPDEPYLVLGGGNNILFTRNVDACVLHIKIHGIHLLAESDDFVIVRAGAGEDWDTFVGYCVEKGWGGLENLSLIPGQVGSCPIQNIGAYGAEVKDVIEEVSCLNVEAGTNISLSNEACMFAYRSSIFKTMLRHTHIITSVTFRLTKNPQPNCSYKAVVDELNRNKIVKPEIKDVRDVICNIRRSKLPDPDIIGNAGSFFKNPVVAASQAQTLLKSFPEMVCFTQEDASVKLAAGWLIEKCGWKGYREGDAGVHDKQALVLVNHGKATGTQILALADKICKNVNDTFDVELEKEVNVY